MIFTKLVLVLLYVGFGSTRVYKKRQHSTSDLYDKQALLGSDIELNCDLTEKYGNKLTWRKLIGRMSDESEEKDGKLVLHDLQEQDAGDYECFVNDYRSIVRLDILKQQETTTTTTIHTNTVTFNSKYQSYIIKQVGENVEIYCEFTNEPKLKWRKLDGLISRFKTEYGAPNNRLLIYYLNEQDSGEYECYLPDGRTSSIKLSIVDKQNEEFSSNEESSNQIENQNQHGQDYDLDLNSSTNIRLITEPIQSTNKPSDERKKKSLGKQIETQTDMFVSFKCGLETNDKSEIYWRKLDGTEIESNVFVNGDEISINNFNQNNAGVYECYLPDGQAEQTNLIYKETDILSLNEQAQQETTVQPEVNHDLIVLNEQAGNDVILSCPLLTNSHHHGDWRKVDGNIDYLRVNTVQNGIRLSNLQPTDSGLYECSLENRVHQIRLTVHIGEGYNDFNQHTKHPEQEHHQPEVYNHSEHYPTQAPYHHEETHHQSEAPYRHEETHHQSEAPYHHEDARHPTYVEHEQHNQHQQDSNNHNINYDTHYTEYPAHIDNHHTQQVYKPQTYPAHSENENVFDENHPNYNYIQEETKVCNENQATCRNGQCIPLSSRCDGRVDCSDGSDEECNQIPNLNNQKCQPNEKSCRNGACIQKIWFCDGEKDCEDGSDEESCTGSSNHEKCQSYEHMCANNNQCVYKGFLCDKQPDCTDNSDEIGCEQPRITQNPVRNMKVHLGSTFRIECHAAGFPTPFINWRLNWGHVCEEPRCNITNDNGKGVLVVSDTRRYDAGAYSCEAINSNGREFAVPDTIVEILETTTITTTTITTTTPVPESPPPVQECNCHNHSDRCTCGLNCYDCQHNTYGKHCELCLPGFYGDATRGTPFDCLPYTTTITTTTPEPPTTHAPVIPIETSDCFCHNHADECTCGGFCLNCRHNTKGKYCDECADGYEGNAKNGTPFDCRPIGDYVRQAPIVKKLVQIKESNFNKHETINTKYLCNSYGTSQIMDNMCKCKANVIGKYCDQCAPKSFNLMTNREYKRGCLSCFCNGLEVDCKSSDLYYNQLNADFSSESSEWFISDRFTKLTESLDLNQNAIEFNRFEQFEDKDMFILVPNKFKGNKLSSYGGNITLTLRFDSVSNDVTNNFELRLSGSQVNIVYKSSEKLLPNVNNQITIPLYEDEFKRYGDNGKVNREHMLMALSDIKLIMIRAHYSPDQTLVRLNEFSIDIADSNPSSILASSVEICSCPEGYFGNSCEKCAPGYQRSASGFFIGLCERISLKKKRY